MYDYQKRKCSNCGRAIKPTAYAGSVPTKRGRHHYCDRLPCAMMLSQKLMERQIRENPLINFA